MESRDFKTGKKDKPIVMNSIIKGIVQPKIKPSVSIHFLDHQNDNFIIPNPWNESFNSCHDSENSVLVTVIWTRAAWCFVKIMRIRVCKYWQNFILRQAISFICFSWIDFSLSSGFLMTNGLIRFSTTTFILQNQIRSNDKSMSNTPSVPHLSDFKCTGS